jgi:hypothetical protein
MRYLLFLFAMINAGQAAAQTCDTQEAKARIEPSIAGAKHMIPIGKRLVANDAMFGPGTRSWGKDKMNTSEYTLLQKLVSSGAVAIVRLPHTGENGWNELDAIAQGVYDVVDIQPAGITSDPTYKSEGPWAISVQTEKAVSNFNVIDATLLRSVTDTFCLVSYTYHSDHNPTIAPALGLPLSDDRKVRQLAKYDVFQKLWTFVAADGGFLAGQFTTNNVDSAVARFRLTR